MVEENYSNLAKKMVSRVSELKSQYPGVSNSINNLQMNLKVRMEKLFAKFQELPARDRDILTLLVINEIHKTVDEAFSD